MSSPEASCAGVDKAPLDGTDKLKFNAENQLEVDQQTSLRPSVESAPRFGKQQRLSGWLSSGAR
jgi:hypothetical protein